jgi:purine-cytosine permease-like protein
MYNDSGLCKEHFEISDWKSSIVFCHVSGWIFIALASLIFLLLPETQPLISFVCAVPGCVFISIFCFVFGQWFKSHPPHGDLYAEPVQQIEQDSK